MSHLFGSLFGAPAGTYYPDQEENLDGPTAAVAGNVYAMGDESAETDFASGSDALLYAFSICSPGTVTWAIEKTGTADRVLSGTSTLNQGTSMHFPEGLRVPTGFKVIISGTADITIIFDRVDD